MPQHGKSLSVGIAGARRQREGLGPFVAKFLREEGVKIAGVCGRSMESASLASAELKKSLGIEAPPFPDLPALLRETRPDGVAICTPFEAHEQNLLDAAAGGVSVLCEKPLIWSDGKDAVKATERVLDRFAAAKRGIVLNAQWPQMMAPFFSLYPEEEKREPQRFEMHLGPSGVGKTMLLDSMSHPLSLLFHRAGAGRVEEISISYRENGEKAEMDLAFAFLHARGSVDCLVHLRTETVRPRKAWFAWNGKRADREIRPANYSFALRGESRVVETEDPMRLQIRDFLQAMRGEKPFASREVLRAHSEGLAAFVRAFESRKQP